MFGKGSGSCSFLTLLCRKTCPEGSVCGGQIAGSGDSLLRAVAASTVTNRETVAAAYRPTVSSTAKSSLPRQLQTANNLQRQLYRLSTGKRLQLCILTATTLPVFHWKTPAAFYFDSDNFTGFPLEKPPVLYLQRQIYRPSVRKRLQFCICSDKFTGFPLENACSFVFAATTLSAVLWKTP